MNDAQRKIKRHHKWLTRWRSGAFTEQVFVERFTIMTIGPTEKGRRLLRLVDKSFAPQGSSS
jgi:hypothetical protein